MEKIVLDQEGVFPVVKDCDDRATDRLPKTGFNLSGTIQGEGYLAGVPSLFIRLSGCNLRCIWQMDSGGYSRCDTTYASFHPDHTIEMETDKVVQWVKFNLNNLRHVVITGGEPLLQKNALTELCQQLKTELQVHITLETNGTLFDADLAAWVDLFSISPKLSNSSPDAEKLAFYKLPLTGPYQLHQNRRRNIGVLQSYIDLCRKTEKQLQLKFVVGKQRDALEIHADYLSHLNHFKTSEVLLMPLGATREELAETSPMVLSMAIANGWRFSPRIHIELFGSISGV